MELPIVAWAVMYEEAARSVFGALAFVPRLGRYSIVGTLWALYLVYAGAPLLMKVSGERATPFGVAAAVAAAAVGLLIEGLRLLT